MIYKRHLFMFGPTGSYFPDRSEALGLKKLIGMGSDEKWEVASQEGQEQRTWWRKWLKIR